METINNVAALVTALVNGEKEVLKRHAIRHAPTIGRMYEGLTQKAVDIAIPAEAKLVVGSGFLRYPDNSYSDEQDVVIAFGDHESIPHTSSYIFDPARIIAVIEVKKNLGSSSLGEAVKNLNTVVRLEHLQDLGFSDVGYAFQDVTKRVLFDFDEANRLADLDAAVFKQIFQRQALPLRIVLGYEGYSTEKGLRDGLSNLIKQELEEKGGLAPIHLPDAILAATSSIVTSASRPWSAPIQENGRWPFLLSNGFLPSAIVLLEMLWTRLQQLQIVELEAFGEDLSIEPWNRFVDLEWSTTPAGWNLHEWLAKKAALTKPEPVVREWEPTVVTDDEAVLLQQLGRVPSKNLYEFGSDWINALGTFYLLEEHGLVGRHALNPGEIGLLTRRLVSIIAPDGKTYVGDNVSGRLVRWLLKNKRIPHDSGGQYISALRVKKGADGKVQGVQQLLPSNGIGWTDIIQSTA